MPAHDETPAGWIFNAEGEAFDAVGQLERYGAVWGWSFEDAARTEQLAPGQPAFLASGVGEAAALVAYGEVSGTAYTDPGEPDGEIFIDLELFSLVIPIPLRALADRPVLAELELLTDPGRPNPFLLTAAQVDDLDTFELDTLEPTEEQEAAYDADADYEPDFVLVGGEAGSWGIYLDADAEPAEFVVDHSAPDGTETEVGRHPDYAAAVASLVAQADAVGAAAPVGLVPADGDPDGELEVAEPVAGFALEGATLSIVKVAEDQFVAFEVADDEDGDAPVVGTWSTLGAAIVEALASYTEADEA